VPAQIALGKAELAYLPLHAAAGILKVMLVLRAARKLAEDIQEGPQSDGALDVGELLDLAVIGVVALSCHRRRS
jgi:hypothetical protein